MFLLINFLIGMVNICGIVGCGNRANREKDRSFHRIPGIVKHKGPETEERSRHRREATGFNKQRGPYRGEASIRESVQ